MKKKLAFACLLLAGTSAYAQHAVTLSPEVGISAVQSHGWGQEWRPSVRTGLAVGFDLTNHFGIESGLFYTFRGYGISNGGIYSNDDATWMENVSQTRHFLQLPILAKFSWNLNEDTKLFFGVGPYVGICLKTRFDRNPYLLEGNFPAEDQQYYDGYVYGEDQFGNSNQFLYEEARRFDWGITANVGLEVRQWYMKLQYDLSLGKESKHDVIGANYHTVSLSAGYKFHL